VAGIGLIEFLDRLRGLTRDKRDVIDIGRMK